MQKPFLALLETDLPPHPKLGRLLTFCLIGSESNSDTERHSLATCPNPPHLNHLVLLVDWRLFWVF